eukprot:g607.t1
MRRLRSPIGSHIFIRQRHFSTKKWSTAGTKKGLRYRVPERPAHSDDPSSPLTLAAGMESLHDSPLWQSLIKKRDRGESLTILGIETSCDDTCVSILRTNPSFRMNITGSPTTSVAVPDASSHVRSDEPFVRILGECVSSQWDLVSTHGGIVPNLAARAHENNFDHVLSEALRQLEASKVFKRKKKLRTRPSVVNFDTIAQSLDARLGYIDAIAVTVGPGMALCLDVGLQRAKQMAKMLNIPLIPVNHVEAHILTARMESAMEPPSNTTRAGGTDLPMSHQHHKYPINALPQEIKPAYPFLAIVLSGGHSNLFLAGQKKKTTGSMKKGGHTDNANHRRSKQVTLGDDGYFNLGCTRDDSVGETFDKLARLLEIGIHDPKNSNKENAATIETDDEKAGEIKDTKTMSMTNDGNKSTMLHGGAAIEALAAQGSPDRFHFKVPRMRNPKGLEFSFSGIKTAAHELYRNFTIPSGSSTNNIQSKSAEQRTIFISDLAASFQRCAFDQIENRIALALDWVCDRHDLRFDKEKGSEVFKSVIQNIPMFTEVIKADELSSGSSQPQQPRVESLVVSGGVAANMSLRERIAGLVNASNLGHKLIIPKSQKKRKTFQKLSVHQYKEGLVLPPIELRYPSRKYCVDNASMIAWTGIERIYEYGVDEPSSGKGIPMKPAQKKKKNDKGSNRNDTHSETTEGKRQELDYIDYFPRLKLG